MTDVPKIVHHRLRATTPEQQMLERAHPEADVLTAFAEQTLSQGEREGLLEHLALCADCREVVALALPALDLTVTPAETENEAIRTPVPDRVRNNWLAWANLHWGHLSWAALAAGIAVAVLVVRPGLDHLGKPHQPVTAVANQPTAPTGAPASPAQIAAGSSPESSVPEKLRPEKGVEAKTRTAGAKSKSSSDRLDATTPSPQPWPRTLIANNGKRAPTAGKIAARAPEAQSSTTESIAIARDEVAVATPPSVNNFMINGAEAPPIEKAKPALQDSDVVHGKQLASTASTIAGAPARVASQARVAAFAAPPAIATNQNASWTISAGVLQRSLDGGQSWQTAVRADHVLLCYASRGQEIWAGGQAGTLLHSTDGGTTWSAVIFSFKGHPLSSDITHIEVQAPPEIVLATSNHETWNSADGGKSWEKK